MVASSSILIRNQGAAASSGGRRVVSFSDLWDFRGRSPLYEKRIMCAARSYKRRNVVCCLMKYPTGLCVRFVTA